jgi:MFS family permease
VANQFALLRQRRFAPFFGAQFLGAFNDNLFKTALVTVITFDALHWTTISAGLLNNLIAGLFILPFLLLSATAGQIADKFDKTKLMRIVKLMEIAIMAVAAIGWYTHSLWLLVAAVVWLGSGSRSPLMRGAVLGAGWCGTIGFVGGFFGPMLFAPDANQGPMLGLFITGPGGVVFGALAGLALAAGKPG